MKKLLGILASLFVISGCGGGGGSEGNSARPVARVEVTPTAILFNGAGQAQAVKVRAFDANNVEIPNAPITFTSSQPAQVSVNDRGIVTAEISVGSSILTAQSGNVAAPPLLVTAVDTYPNTILVSDSQILTGPQPLPGTVNGIGGRYTVIVTGIATPSVGTIVLASGSYPIAGKVVNAQTIGGNAVNVTLELVPLNQIFRNASVSGSMPVKQVAQFVSLANKASVANSAGNLKHATPAGSKKFGQLECATSFDTNLVTVDVNPTITQALGFAYDISILDGVSKAFLLEFSGSIDASVTGTITVGAAKGSLECLAPLMTIPIPITGPFAAFIVPESPLGIKIRMELDASTNVSYGVSGSVGTNVTFGIKYDSEGNPVKINDGTVSGKIEIAPAFANTAARVQFTQFGGVTAGLTVGNILGKLPNAIDVSAGSEISSSWGAPYDAAVDSTFATDYQLRAKFAIEPGPGLQKLLELADKLVSIDISASVETIIGRSPMLTSARLSQNQFRAGDTTFFKLTLDPTSARFGFGLGDYNVQEVRIYRLNHTNQQAILIATSIPIEGQTEFTVPWHADVDGVVDTSGNPTFFAFLVPRLLNILRSDFPIELGRIQGPSIEIHPTQSVIQTGAKATFQAFLDGVPSAGGVTWSASGGSVNAIGEYAAGDTPGTFEIRATRTSTGEIAISTVQVQTTIQPPAITSVVVSPNLPSVGDQVTFTVSGSNLISGLIFSFPGCVVTETGGVSSTTKQFICSPIQSGTLQGSITNIQGQVLFSFTAEILPPASPVKNWRTVATGYNFSCALTSGGGVKCWGDNHFGQLGDGKTVSRLTPDYVTGLTSDIVSISARGAQACALSSSGGVKCWGDNLNGYLGDGTTLSRTAPVNVVGLGSGVREISVGSSGACALLASGGVWCWGLNAGDGVLGSKNLVPVSFAGFASGAIEVTSGFHASCVITIAGGIKCSGLNIFGSIGDGTTIDRPLAVDVLGLTSGVKAISGGDDSVCALTITGFVKCWGLRAGGLLTTDFSTVPLDVPGLSAPAANISAGGENGCAILISGGVQCWGYNSNGELGDGTTIAKQAAVGVIGLSQGVVSISTEGNHTCVSMSNGKVKCWGANFQGQLGDGSTTSRSTPVDVTNF